MLEKLKLIGEFFITNGPILLAILAALLAVAETIVSLTATKKDDLFVERIGKFLKKIMAFFKVPNRKTGGGTHPPAV